MVSMAKLKEAYDKCSEAQQLTCLVDFVDHFLLIVYTCKLPKRENSKCGGTACVVFWSEVIGIKCFFFNITVFSFLHSKVSQQYLSVRMGLVLFED